MAEYNCPFIQKYYKPHKNQVQNLDLGQSILMDYCAFNSLNQFLLLHNSVLSLPIKIYFLYQISVGLRFIRDLGIVHLDLKPENILMNQCFSGMINGRTNIIYILRLIDFG